MKVGIVHGMAFPSSSNNKEKLLKTINIIAKDSYFEVIEIDRIKDKAIRDKVKSIIDCSGLEVVYSGHSKLLSNDLNINNLNEEGRKKAVESLKEEIDEAYYMKAKTFSFLSGRYEKGKKEIALKSLVKSTKELCEYSNRRGNLNIVLEIFDHDLDKKSLLGPVNLVEKFVKKVGNLSNFGIMIDLSHLPQLNETPDEAILPVKDYIKHVHIGNSVVKNKEMEAYGDKHPRFGFPNSENGVNEVVKFLETLDSINYFKNRATLSFEIKPREYEDPQIVIANAKRVLKAAVASANIHNS
jgi:sugar phosphate isomerase/epimerase